MQLHSVWPTSTSKKQPSAHPVFHRLWSVGAFVRVTRENVRRFTSAPGLNVLFAADDPSVRKETLDLAALAPDLAATFEDALNAAGFTDFTKFVFAKEFLNLGFERAVFEEANPSKAFGAIVADIFNEAV